ncbi:MAG: DNA mismatch repair endonuclease MutH [Gammaproteobacteria bacterium]|nr:DNA mismatch repair endonuclease MutH [Gammaproteobacteria bacterium]
MITPPSSEQELLCRAERIAGKTLGELANTYASQIPSNLLFEKGWVGQFCEKLLGASAGSLPEPDFPQLGIELKTIPIDSSGRPLESTYVSVVPMSATGETWETSVVFHKLSKVLWLPIMSEKPLSIEQRVVGMPIMWQPNPEQLELIRMDWEEALEKIMLGDHGALNAKFGEVLQVRPKAAHSRVLTEAVGPEGHTVKTLPRGFYLRPSFTQNILRQLTY